MVIALRSRTEIVLGVFVDGTLQVAERAIETSLLQTCDEVLSVFGYKVSNIARLGIVNSAHSFTSTRLLMLLANMTATFGSTKVALLPVNFFEQSIEEQLRVFSRASFSDSLFLGYNGEPNITTPK